MCVENIHFCEFIVDDIIERLIDLLQHALK